MTSRSLRVAVPAALLLLAVVAAPAAAQTYPPPPEVETETISLSSPESVCLVLDTPYLRFSTTFEGQVTVSFVDTSGVPSPGAADLGNFDGVYADDGPPVSGVIRAQSNVDVVGGQLVELLWPGMELDENGDPISWPNWEPTFDDDGQLVGWEQVDDGFGWARTADPTQLGVFVTLGDETTDLYGVTYVDPEASCFEPPETEVIDVVEELDPEDEVSSESGDPSSTPPARVLGVSLARTGFDAGVLALVGIALLGLGFVALRRTHEPQR